MNNAYTLFSTTLPVGEWILLGFLAFLILLGFIFVLIPSKRESGVWIYRILVGVLFVFSGFVKADDPLGFSYKLHEYFAKDALNLPWLDKFSFGFAFSLPLIEMILGLMLLLGSKKIITLVLILLMLIFFTFLTWYTAHYNKVLECGCFGDAIPMTSWQSFWKNVILLVLSVSLLIGNKYITPTFKSSFRNFLIIAFSVGSFAFSWYCYNYLPIFDFRPYKVGTDIKAAMKGIPDEEKFYYTLKNKKSNEIKEFDKFPDNYQSGWTYLSSRTVILKKGVEPTIKDFNISSLSGNDVTDSILKSQGNTFLLISQNISEADTDYGVINKINSLASDCLNRNMGFICLTASDPKEIDAYKKRFNPPYKFYSTDGTVLKTMIRSNPGLMLLKGGKVISMWHYHSIPTFASLTAKVGE